MNKYRFQKILEHIAKENHCTPEEIRCEMQAAMEAGLSSPDPAVQARWQAIPRKGAVLTLEEFIEYMAQVTTLVT